MKLGPCCGCERPDEVRAIFMINRVGPQPGKGWGCGICDLPANGAMAVLCDECADAKNVRFVCDGYPADKARVPIEALATAYFDHDRSVDHG